MKRIWFKSDCVEWIRKGKKITTWRSRKHLGEYQVVQGSWFKPIPIKPELTVMLYPTSDDKIRLKTLIKFGYKLEGDFHSPREFKDWLIKNKIYKEGAVGWLHRITVLK